MIEQIVKDFLTARLGVPIKTEVPESPPAPLLFWSAPTASTAPASSDARWLCRAVRRRCCQAAQLDDRAIEANGSPGSSWTAWARAAWCAIQLYRHREQALSVSGGV